MESFCKHPKILEISKLYAEFFLISAAIRLRGSPGVDGFQLKKNPDLANLLKYHTQQNIACGKFYLEQILSLRKLVAMALYRVKIQIISKLITKVKNKKIMTAIPNI